MMARTGEDQDSFPGHLAGNTDATKPYPQAIEIGQESHVGLKPELGHQFTRNLQWNFSLDEGEPRDQGSDVIVNQPRFSRLEKYITFYRLHMVYFLTLGGFGTVGMYVLPLSNSTTLTRLSFVDAIYTSFSAMCGTGLQTVRSEDLTQFHNFIILLLMVLGAPVLISLLPVYVRRFFFHLCIKECYQNPCKHQDKCASLAQDVKPEHNFDLEQVERELKRMDFPSPSFNKGKSQHSRATILSMEVDFKSVDNTGDPRGDQPTTYTHMGNPGENWRILVDANQALRTSEYRALVALSWVVISFFIGGQIIGFLLGAIYFFVSRSDAHISRRMDINPTFYAFFTASSTFTNGGYSLNNDGMLPFHKSTFLLILYAILASLGNTLYAPFLRLLVWIFHQLSGEKNKAAYKYLLHHPRRCFTNLFPRSQTIWLVVIFIGCTGLQLVFFCILEWNEALGGMTPLQKLITGVYQAVGTRNAGGNAVNLYRVAPAVLFMFLIMMYISAYPNFLSLQTSNEAYDDAELLTPSACKKDVNPNQWKSIVVVQSRILLARDTSYLFFAILFLLLSENTSIKKDPLNFSIFNIVFEVISAYGSSGLSVGYHCDLRVEKTKPCEKVPYSFSGTWTSTGKLIVVVIMCLGRHRGLPDNVDSAIRLPTKPIPPRPPQTPHTCEAVQKNFLWIYFTTFLGDPRIIFTLLLASLILRMPAPCRSTQPSQKVQESKPRRLSLECTYKSNGRR